jgi:ferredoxin
MIYLACTAEERDECRCAWPYPSRIDVGEKVEGIADALVAEHEELSLAERTEFWQKQFRRCLKCYACRTVCPQCFCEHLRAGGQQVGRERVSWPRPSPPITSSAPITPWPSAWAAPSASRLVRPTSPDGALHPAAPRRRADVQLRAGAQRGRPATVGRRDAVVRSVNLWIIRTF